MSIVNDILMLLAAPLNWADALILRDRFLCYPGQIVQFIGIPGAGKSMSTVCMIERTQKYIKRNNRRAGKGKKRFRRLKKIPPRPVYCTADLAYKDGYIINADDLAKYRFRYSIIALDESSLNGFDSREWGSNFRGENRNKLYQVKLVRHYHNCIITTSQSVNDNDSKVRDICVTTWDCKNIGFGLIKAEKCLVTYDFINGVYKAIINRPSLIRQISDPYCTFLVRKRKYGKLYNSFATSETLDRLPDIATKFKEKSAE